MTLTDAERERLRSNAAAMLAFADGKGAGYRIRGTDGLWMKVEQGHTWGIQLYEYRATPWSLPPPPEGEQWHRATGWRQEHLPDGFRPLLLMETIEAGDETQAAGGGAWNLANLAVGLIAQNQGTWKARTRRPLPSTPVVRPWRFEDFPKAANCWLRLSDRQNPSAALESQVVAISERGINHYSGDFMKFMPWGDKRWLELEYSTTRTNGSWHPCQTPDPRA